MTLKRKIYDRLLEWKTSSNGRTALMVKGARRVGKSYIVNEFGRNEYTSYILIDFNKENDDFRKRFQALRSDLDTLFLFLQEYFNTPLHVRESLIIFDEVQKFTMARELIKYLVQDGRYDYIETGSLITITSKAKKITIPSEEESIQLDPMDFEEFLWALGEDLLFEAARRAYEHSVPVGEPIHRRLMERFRQYMVVGGMPQAVSSFAQDKDFFAVEKIKKSIISLYREDISKARRGLVEKTRAIYDLVPSQLSRHEKKFSLSELEKGARKDSYQEAFQWLDDARLVNMAYNSMDPNIGLKLTKDESSLKCYMADTGLLLSMVFDDNPEIVPDVMRKIALGKLEFNKGMLIENIVAQMLVASGRKLYFYSSYSRLAEDRMEVDFLLSKPNLTSKHNIIPIEVKSSNNYSLTSLRKYMTKFDKYVTDPLVLHFKDLEVKEGITYLPIYMTSLL